jgi:glycosyltransferase involved in cell wall biosynthesis
LHIAFINSLYYPDLLGGAERSVQQLAEGLCARGHAVSVIATPVDGVAREYEHNGVRVFAVPIHNAYHPHSDSKARGRLGRLQWHVRDTSNGAMAAAVGRILERIRPDLVSTHSLAGHSVAVWRAAAALDLPLLHTLRDYYLLCPRSAMYDHRAARPCAQQCLVCKGFSLPRKAASQLLDGVVGISHSILDTHVDAGFFAGLSATRRVIHNGFDAGGVPGFEPPRRPFRFGFLGQLIPEKGLEMLLDAFSLLPEGGAVLHIFGKGEENYVGALKERAKTIAGVSWRGFTPSAQAMAEMDALVVPSLWNEPFGRVVIEAFSHAVPVLGTNRGGVPEIIEASKSGYLFDPGAPPTLVAAMGNMLRMPAADYVAMRRHAWDRAGAFSSAAMLDSHESLIGDIFTARGGCSGNG